MVDFAGWSMPVQYTSIVAEHNATRTGVGLFDISHMGRLRFDGPAAADFLDHLLTRSWQTSAGADSLRPGDLEQGAFSTTCWSTTCGRGRRPVWLLVVNASNREKIVDWILPRFVSAEGGDFLTRLPIGMLAVQGPRAAGAAQLVEPRPR
jgi:aminomethyltransferase